MVELMEYLYVHFSKHGEVFWEDLERDEEGKANIDDIKITYNLPTVLNLTNNKCRSDIPLEINIWGRKEQAFEIEKIIEKINKDLNEELYQSNTLIFVINKDNLFRINHQDVDKNIRRVQLNYVIRFYQ